MNAEAVKHFRKFCRLYDFPDHDQPDEMFAALLGVVRWAEAERSRPCPSNDDFLTAGSDITAVQMGLLLHLATIDRDFFSLAKRMSARTLVRHSPPAPMYLQMAAALLTSAEPRTRSFALARDVAIILAVAVCISNGLRPTESAGKADTSRSGCAKIATALGWQYERVEGIWKARRARLMEAGFTEDQVSEFFRVISPMIGRTN